MVLPGHQYRWVDHQDHPDHYLRPQAAHHPVKIICLHLQDLLSHQAYRLNHQLVSSLYQPQQEEELPPNSLAPRQLLNFSWISISPIYFCSTAAHEHSNQYFIGNLIDPYFYSKVIHFIAFQLDGPYCWSSKHLKKQSNRSLIGSSSVNNLARGKQANLIREGSCLGPSLNRQSLCCKL